MSNTRRVLAEVLAIDAWHGPMKIDGTTFSVHVELSFKEGRIGGDDESYPFTFNLALKRALLILKVESPLRIQRSSIARQIPATQTEKSQIIATRDEIKSSSSLGGSISPKSFSAALAAKSEHARVGTNEQQLKVVQAIPRIMATPIPHGPNEYAWELIPGHLEILNGQPWDPVAEPRFAVKYNTDTGTRLAPVIKAAVVCRIEDLEVKDLRLKSPGVGDILKEMVFHRMNEAAAIQHLKITLGELQLEAGLFQDALSFLTVADVLVTEE